MRNKVNASLDFNFIIRAFTHKDAAVKYLLACIQPVKVEFPSAGPVLRLLQSLSVDLGGVRLRQSKLHHVRERTLLQLVAVQRQKLLELTAHVTVLGGGHTT